MFVHRECTECSAFGAPNFRVLLHEPLWLKNATLTQARLSTVTSLRAFQYTASVLTHHLDTYACNNGKHYSLVIDYSFCCMGLAYEVTSFLVGARESQKCRQENNCYSESWSPPTALMDMKLQERRKTLWDARTVQSKRWKSFWILISVT